MIANCREYLKGANPFQRIRLAIAVRQQIAFWCSRPPMSVFAAIKPALAPKKAQNIDAEAFGACCAAIQVRQIF